MSRIIFPLDGSRRCLLHATDYLTALSVLSTPSSSSPPPLPTSLPRRRHGHTGRILDGNLLLERKLGAGAFGEVYFAHDTTTDPPTPYAVKCMRKLKPTDHHFKNQVRECTLHALVSDHPNIVTLHKVIEDDEFIYMVLDYAEGGDLFDAMDDYQRNDEKTKAAFVQILNAVEYSHSKGVYHRDLKPENIFLKDGSCLIGDFGLATPFTRSRERGCGSYAYMSPESIPQGPHASSLAFSHVKADIWSLGVLLFNLATGLTIWKVADERQDNNFRIFCNNPRLLQEHFGLSEAFFQLIRTMLDLDPLERPTLPEIRAALEQIPTFFAKQGRPASTVPYLSPASSLSTPSEDESGPITPGTHALDSGTKVEKCGTKGVNELAKGLVEAKTGLGALNGRISTIYV